ncbi:heavy metal translocating P-type ATPase [Rhodoplanes sp. TEM]|uniref:Heavy metal translocating P-type ATPase n=1 Tax=Rhodoplanes tepidamans TaxID=200616 RepID=A0ABT5J9W6_RHOTP|nr:MULTISPECIES: heavy metal translocating P-type ATPase [Rhodoplanes]MDC7786371.1 heavy metal translocating P-type ATPase [Rhodoplanes tepidamans]MDC7985443.1 heavy metal translocating P-type ATPase [Rhodoplanes sp. TEM]MDQ0354115.1 Cu2+-exporting ATPase [Rhodoplanes tepidamans]
MTETPDLTHPDLSHFVEKLDDGRARLNLAVEGMTCAACMFEIEGGLGALPHVTQARANLTSGRVAIEWEEGEGPERLDPTAIVGRLAALGYKAYPYDSRRMEADEQQEARFLLRCLGVAAFAAMNVMLLSVSVWSGNVSDITPEQRDFFHWLSALIALPAVAYAGQPFFRSATRALMAGRLNMDVPITLGVLLALGLSVFETLHHAEHAYFDSAVMLLAFLLAGRWLDQNMRRRTRAVAANLAALKAETATKFVSADEISEVPVAAIRPGDLVLVRPGERIAVDGEVEDGRSEIDQSLVTGETAHVTAERGTLVYAGTLNVNGTLRVRVGAADRGTLLDEVTRLLDRAVEARSHYVRLAERAARLYAPVVHLTALATVVGWLLLGAGWHFAVVTAVAVLIITCPCALGLAIPAVQVVASGALFRGGVLLSSGDAIERLAGVDTIVFDKTGTLTLPEPELVDAGRVPPETLALAGRLALTSRHPLAAAIARAAGANAPLDGASEEPGQGVSATVDGDDGLVREVLLGRPSWCGAEQEAARVAATDPEASVIAFRDGTRTAVFAVRQRLREDATAVLAGLRAKGYAVEILSGDREAAVAHVARQLGVSTVRAGATPADKIAHVEALRAAGRKVLMVGDGINDAPALAAADVSLSPVTAAHLTQSASDAVFLGDRLQPVATALAVTRRARRIMTENLWLAVVYNAVAVPIAIIGYATPLVAAVAMSGSSMLVILNALRARPRRAAADADFAPAAARPI